MSVYNSVEQLTGLTSLAIHENLGPPPYLSNLTNLKSLSVSNGWLVDLIRLTQLERLSIGRVNVSAGYSTHQAFEGMRQLTNLTFAKSYDRSSSRWEVPWQQPGVLRQCSALKVLIVCGRFTDPFMREAPCTLRELRILDNQLVSDDGVMHLTALRTLSLRRTVGISDRAMRAMPNLRSLRLEGVSGLSVRAFDTLTRLTSLHYPVYNIPLRDAARQHMLMLRTPQTTVVVRFRTRCRTFWLTPRCRMGLGFRFDMTGWMILFVTFVLCVSGLWVFTEYLLSRK